MQQDFISTCLDRFEVAQQQNQAEGQNTCNFMKQKVDFESRFLENVYELLCPVAFCVDVSQD